MGFSTIGVNAMPRGFFYAVTSRMLNQIPPSAAERCTYLGQVVHRLQLASDGHWTQLIVEATNAVVAVRSRAPPTNGQTNGELSEW